MLPVFAFSAFTMLASVIINGADPLSIPGVEDSAAVGPVLATNGSGGSTVVSLFQIGRFSGDAAAGMAFSVSTNGGQTWNATWLPGLTRAQSPSNPYDRVTYESIAWNQKYGEFLASVLPISNVAEPQYGETDTTLPPVVLRSGNGFTWTAPQPVTNGAGEIRPEKNYIACDNNASSRYYGNCYVAWDDNDNNDAFHAATSTNGGVTWGPTLNSANGHSSFGGQPVILPNGTVVVVTEDSSGYDGTAENIIAFVSTNGGASWSAAYEVSPLTTHTVAGDMRTQGLPSTAVDASGTIYTVWQDCRFRSGCSSNDIVLSESRNGIQWSTPYRVPLDSTTSGADHFLPTLAARSTIFGTTLGLSYYGYPNANCTAATCTPYAYFADSYNDGGSWSSPAALAGPFNNTWFASTGAGYMVADYFESAYPVYGYIAPVTVASPPTGSTYHEMVGVSLGNGYNLWDQSRLARVAGARPGLGAADSLSLHTKAKKFDPPVNPAQLAPWRKLGKHASRTS
jgi:hypothetical protein